MEWIVYYFAVGFFLDVIIMITGHGKRLNWKARAWFYFLWPLVTTVAVYQVATGSRK